MLKWHQVVGVAEWLRRQVVALEIEGSNPSAHPYSIFDTLRLGK
jgi:hypothetical protein